MNNYTGASALKTSSSKLAKQNNSPPGGKMVSLQTETEKSTILYKNNYIPKDEQGKNYVSQTRIIKNADFSAVGGNPKSSPEPSSNIPQK